MCLNRFVKTLPPLYTMETSMHLVVGWVIKLSAEALTSSGGDDVNKLCD